MSAIFANHNTSYYVDLTDIPDSMLLESETQVAAYHNEKTDVHLSLEVRGEVSVTYKEETYHGVKEFPEELRKKIYDGSYLNDQDIYVGFNNWFELFELDEKDNCTGRTWVVDAENYTQADIDSLFADTEYEILLERGKEEERDL